MKDNRILIVDDGQFNRLLIKAILNSYGYDNIVEAINGKDAIDKASIDTFDIIFMDIMMPVMDGIEATQYIRTVLNLKIPIIAITAYDNISAMSNGFDILLKKPVKVEVIQSILELYLENNNEPDI